MLTDTPPKITEILVSCEGSITVTPSVFIFVTLQFEATHCYPDAPDEVAFLRHEHRHVFHVKVKLQVYHDDRELEFILVKRALQAYTSEHLGELNNKSCEMIAKDYLAFVDNAYGLRNCTIEVSEDGENGAILERLINGKQAQVYNH